VIRCCCYKFSILSTIFHIIDENKLIYTQIAITTLIKPHRLQLGIDNNLYHAPHINNQHPNQIGLKSIQCCLQVKSFLIKILFNFSICFVRPTLIDEIDYSVINTQHRQNHLDRVIFYIESTKIGVQTLDKGCAVNII